ncbi:hypothetical protein RA307_27025 [Xanthobacteraceae bacterium Astr-EGSB]|uniref:hypothetical protein n=1 Tax=Astrobacterium formosum TaxID=3069710 RepID=UPI0027AEA3B7|nr:hypothetical protein [Xanthobacteraceae bacterium Astr-EGSB]
MFSRFSLITTAAALAIWFGPSSSAAIAACQTWQLPAEFNAVEDSGAFVVFSLKKGKDSGYDGLVRYTDWKTYREVKGRATAILTGAKLDITAAWTTTPTGGGHYTYYKGTISNGSIGGLRTDPTLRKGDKNRDVFWKSKQKATCAATTKSVVDRTRDRVLAERNKRVREALRPSEAWRPGRRPATQ